MILRRYLLVSRLAVTSAKSICLSDDEPVMIYEDRVASYEQFALIDVASKTIRRCPITYVYQ